MAFHRNKHTLSPNIGFQILFSLKGICTPEETADFWPRSGKVQNGHFVLEEKRKKKNKEALKRGQVQKHRSHL